MAEALSVNPEHKFINTTSGSFNYDILVLVTGGKTYYYGNKKLEKKSSLRLILKLDQQSS